MSCTLVNTNIFVSPSVETEMLTHREALHNHCLRKGSFITYVKVPRERERERERGGGLEKSLHILTLGEGGKLILT